MQYIRFLKTPRFVYTNDRCSGAALALVTITSDLGESFFFQDVALTAKLLDGESWTSLPLSVARHTWKAGMRTLKIELDLVIKQKEMIHRTAVLSVSSEQTAADDLSQLEGADSLVLSAYSSPFGLVGGIEAEGYVERRLTIGRKMALPVWEETGESIARHIWDGGLALTVYLAQNILTSEVNNGGKRLDAIDKILGLPEDLEVLELGSGCGIVGLALASLYKNCRVTLTDLPLAEEIIVRNLRCSGLQGNVNFKPLDWDQNIPENFTAKPIRLIVVADCTYNASSAPSLVRVLAELSRRSPGAVTLLAHKRRHDSEDVFFQLMDKSFRKIEQIQRALGTDSNEEATNVDIYVFQLF
ncbi:putative methyltransferase-domain-containing protein [Tuber brumale]|nr:putative methyltransferase-domain-containing protein [Tuber brumale]